MVKLCRRKPGKKKNSVAMSIRWGSMESIICEKKTLKIVNYELL